MARPLRHTLLKPLASLLKRYHVLLHGGYSISRAYGCRFLIDWRHPIDKKLVFRMFENDRIVFFNGMVEHLQPQVFLDIGAHAALYSILAKSRVPAMETHAFEPDRTNLCQLHANLFLNKLERQILVHEHGLSDHQGMVGFDTSDEHERRGLRKVSVSGTSSIEVRRLDDVLKFRGQTVAAKIDVEGHECEVMAGAQEFLAGNKCYLQIESRDQNLPKLKELLSAVGYRLVVSMGDHYFSNLPDEALRK